MKFENPIRYLARAYYKAPPNIQNTAVHQELADILGVKGFDIQAGSGVNMSTGQGITGVRLRAGAWAIMRTSESIDFEMLHGPKSEPSYKDFALTASKVLACITAQDTSKAVRIASVQEGLNNSLSSKQLDELGGQMLSPPALLSGPFEWDWRCAAKIERKLQSEVEVTNTIAGIKRTRGQINDLEFDGLLITLDINTPPENEQPRFDSARINEFFSESVQWFSELGASVAATMEGK